jgi:hydroxymethylglutaryl-CoA lyase
MRPTRTSSSRASPPSGRPARCPSGRGLPPSPKRTAGSGTSSATPTAPPVRVGVSIGDSIAGLYAAFGSMMSLYQREARRGNAGGAGPLSPVPLTERVIDVALNEAMFSMMESLIPDYQAYGVDRQRVGGRMEGIAPSNAYICRDGASIVVAGNGDSIYQRYMQTIGRPDLAEDPTLQSNAGRWDRREELDQAIGAWTAELDAADALAALDAAGVPAGPIYTAADISTDSQYAARNMVQKFDVSTGEEILPGVGFPGIVPVIGERIAPHPEPRPGPGRKHGRNPRRTPRHGPGRDQCGLGPRGGTPGMNQHHTSAPNLASTLGGAILRDVTLRDGLQLTGKVLSTERKLETVRELLRLGVPAIELGSMARPDLVPTMANTLEVVQNLTPEELEKCWIWVATPGHVAKAAAAGARNFQYCLSASDSHNKANIGRTTEESLAALPQAVEYAQEVNGQIQLCIATSFTCPFEGTVPEERVLAIANDPRAEGTTDIVLCDTLGQAIPAQVSGLIQRVRAESPARRIVYHGHDTWGLGVANTLAAIQAGAAMVDGALGGLGGCPFAPGASGNTSSEDILFATRPGWVTPETFADLVVLSEKLLAELGEPNRSKAAQGARSKAPAFRWVIPSDSPEASVACTTGGK